MGSGLKQASATGCAELGLVIKPPGPCFLPTELCKGRDHIYAFATLHLALCRTPGKFP